MTSPLRCSRRFTSSSASRSFFTDMGGPFRTAGGETETQARVSRFSTSLLSVLPQTEHRKKKEKSIRSDEDQHCFLNYYRPEVIYIYIINVCYSLKDITERLGTQCQSLRKLVFAAEDIVLIKQRVCFMSVALLSS